jgi:AcrR family transcriptional regulator
MCPKHVVFDNPKILRAAIEVVRRKSLESLSARSVARCLGSSVAPVYYSFRSMESVRREVLESARHLMKEKATRAFTDIGFLNIGIGVVVFAREEGQLFRALVHSRADAQDISSDFYASARIGMKKDTMLRRLPDAALKRLWDSFWLYTLGLATTMAFVGEAERTDENIIRQLKNTANTLIFAEIAGISDCESPDNAREWSRLLMEKKIIVPPEG